MGLVKLINKGINLLTNGVRWLNYAWVDEHGYKYMRRLFLSTYKILLVLSYMGFALSLFIGIILSMTGKPLLAAFIIIVMFLCLPLLAAVINVRPRE